MRLECEGLHKHSCVERSVYDAEPWEMFAPSVRMVWRSLGNVPESCDVSPSLFDEVSHSDGKTGPEPLAGFVTLQADGAWRLVLSRTPVADTKIVLAIDTQRLCRLLEAEANRRNLDPRRIGDEITGQIEFNYKIGKRDYPPLSLLVAIKVATPVGAGAPEGAQAPEPEVAPAEPGDERADRAPQRPRRTGAVPQLLLKPVDVGAVERSDGFSPSQLVPGLEGLAIKDDVFQVELNRSAPVRHRREFLFGFRLEQASASPLGTLAAISVTLQLGASLGEVLGAGTMSATEPSPPRRFPFGIAQLQRLEDGWNRSAVSSKASPSRCPVVRMLPPQLADLTTPDAVKATLASTLVLEFVLATDLDYGFFVDLDEIDFQIERLFWTAGHRTRPEARFDIEIQQSVELDHGGRSYFEMGKYSFGLPPQPRACLLVHVPGCDQARVFPGPEAASGTQELSENKQPYHVPLAPRAESRAGRPAESRAFPLSIRNIGAEPCKLNLMSNDGIEIKQQGDEAPNSLINPNKITQFEIGFVKPSISKFAFRIPWTIWPPQGNVIVLSPLKFEIEPATRIKPHIIAFDIGTTAIAAAVEIGDSDARVMVPLGSVVNTFTSSKRLSSRREIDFTDAMPAICGLTLEDPKGYVPPIQASQAFDPRFVLLAALGSEISHAKARMAVSETAIDIHLPVYERKSEADPIDIRGFVILDCAKTAVCRSSTTDFGADATGSDQNAVKVLHRLPGDGASAVDVFGAIPAGEVKSVDILEATFDSLLYAYLPQAFRLAPKLAGVAPRYLQDSSFDYHMVMTYPASISKQAQKRYEEALRRVLKRIEAGQQAPRGNPPRPRGRLQQKLVTEAMAVAWELLDHRSTLWEPSSNGSKTGQTVVNRLVLFDVGAGTFDVAAFDFWPGEDLAPIRQTVSFSLPVAGNLVDEAIALDFNAAAGLGVASSPEVGLLQRIELGKRCMNKDWLLPVPKHQKSSGSDDPVRGFAGVSAFGPNDSEKPFTGDEFAPLGPHRGKTYAPELGHRPSRRMLIWDVLDLGCSHRHLDALLAMIRTVIVPSAMKAAAADAPASAVTVDTVVVLSGRACLFAPLQEAIRAGVRTSKPAGATADRLIIKLASDVLAQSRHSPDWPFGTAQQRAAETMKGIVVKGALRWARRTIDARRRLFPPVQRQFAASFALLTGTWDAKRGRFVAIKALRDINIDSDTVRADGGDLFLVVRPPLFDAIEDIKYLLEDRSRFGQDLIDRLIRPIIVRPQNGDAENAEWALPLLAGATCPLAPVELAAAGRTIDITAIYTNDSLDLLISGEGWAKPQTLRLSSTFIIEPINER